MTNILRYLVLFFLSTNCFSQSETDIFGNWKNKNNNYISQIEFKNDNTAILFSDNNLPSPPFEVKIDYTKKPIWVDLKLEKNGIVSVVFGLVEFIDNHTMKFELHLYPKDNHPINFSGDNNDSIVSFILNKT
ncbi:hypothetical protein JE952_002371 [Flavobacterium psychrophilum]|uniref:hypothetical protein n=1 Tax=Flavobacterium psychrophilum TaxID=96345 RepID=UPI000A37DD0A|nr:hypothetical protein [Flavobacterium psychrophilum]EKT4550717.1 hypothetical protein [Flavobacterium psychrophilum]ELM3645054.1 hypothetical protein [Flavobacterium psychrophilum]OUD22953.1 hypothetical protein FPG92_13215 [Flavobacterium psychrophilum]